jgi:hypothetical protein
MNADELLAHAVKTNADTKFVELCAVALDARAAEEPVWQVYHEALEAFKAASPSYPADLVYKVRVHSYRHALPEGYVAPTEDRHCHPEHDTGPNGVFDLIVGRIAKETGAGRNAVANRLKFEFFAYESARNEARDRYRVKELERDAEAVSRRAAYAFKAVLDHPAQSTETLLTKLQLRREEYEPPSTVEDWSAIVADAERVLNGRTPAPA